MAAKTVFILNAIITGGYYAAAGIGFHTAAALPLGGRGCS